MLGDDLALWYISLGIVLVLAVATIVLTIAWLVSPREPEPLSEEPAGTELTTVS